MRTSDSAALSSATISDQSRGASNGGRGRSTIGRGNNTPCGPGSTFTSTTRQPRFRNPAARCAVRLGGCGRDAALQVDEDERGARWIQRERRHSGFRQEAPAPDAGTGAAGSARALPNDRRFACTMPHFTRYADAAAISSTHSSMYTFSPSNQSTGWPLSVGSENSEWAKKNAADTYATQCSSFHVWRVIRCRTYDVTTTSANV